MSIEDVHEFDCIECRQHIVRFCAPDKQPFLCMECLMLPGWNSVPGLRETLDPGHLALWVDYEEPA